MKLALMVALATVLTAAPSALAQDTCATASPLPSVTFGVTLTGSASPGGPEEHWLLVDLGPGEAVWFNFVLLLNASPASDGRYAVYDDSCGAVLATGSIEAAERYVNASALPATVRVGLFDQSGADTSMTYLLSATTFLDQCARTVPDSFEPNNTASNATPLMIGRIEGLNASLDDPDFFEWVASPGTDYTLTFDPSYLGVEFARVTLDLVDARTDARIESRQLTSGSGPVQLIIPNETGSARTLQLTVEVDSPISCVAYALELASDLLPCSRLLEDALEGPSDCASSPILSAGVYPGLAVFRDNPDLYRIDVPLGSPDPIACYVKVTPSLTADSAQFFASLRTTCGFGVLPLVPRTDGSLEGLITVAPNATALPAVYVGLGDDGANGCASYALELTTYPVPLGTSFCDQAPSSDPLELIAWGSSSASSNNIWFGLVQNFTATQTLLFAGPERNDTPYVSSFGFTVGRLCVGGAARRIAFSFSLFARPVSFRVDLDDPRLAAIQAGTTWVFQMYVGGFNGRALSNAVAVTFQ